MYQYQIEEFQLAFIKEAKTSRNVFKERLIFIITIESEDGKKGRGEAAPLSFLSVDDIPNYKDILHEQLTAFCAHGKIETVDFQRFPSIRFGIETALLDLNNSDKNKLFETPFTRGEMSIPVNGLVWMNAADKMLDEAIQKIELGFDTIKIKVGALDFDEECRLLEKLRKRYSAFEITLRLDANGGFKPEEVLEQLKELSRFEIHSIEQPIKAGIWDQMSEICTRSPIDIALDEELIGVNPFSHGNNLVKRIEPKYLILKPNLLGGFQVCDEWIRIANSSKIEWWATSALEGNIGLNAISQWVSKYNPSLPQGLGTGSLYKTNAEMPLNLVKGRMHYIV